MSGRSSSRARGRRCLTTLVPALLCAVAPGCSADADVPVPAPTASPSPPTAGEWTAPPVGADVDHQLGGPYDPAPGVTVVVRDRTAPPAGLGYDVCYVNGFQSQPGDSAALARDRPDLLVQTGDGPLVDPGWPDEFLFDTSTPEKRAALTALVGPWIEGCAADGYDAVEIDDLDSASRSGGRLDQDDNLALAYADVAHRAGLAVAQKNTPEASAALRAGGYDFAVAESCLVFDECDAHLAHHAVVLDVEHPDELGVDGFAAACADPDDPASLVLRDHDLLTPADDGHVHRTCDG